MSSQAETAKIEAELKLLCSALDYLTDTSLRKVIEIRIEELRGRLLRFQDILRKS
jgi:hypothetical protein